MKPRTAMLLAIWLGTTPILLSAVPETAQTSVDAETLDREITTTLSRPQYAWRLPRDPRPADTKAPAFWESLSEWVTTAFAKMRELQRRFLEWLRGYFERSDHDQTYDFDWRKGIRAVFVILLATAGGILAVLLLRLWKHRHDTTTPATAIALNAPPDLQDEAVTADRLPPNEWVSMARELLDRGEKRLAIRALFLGSLAHLGRRELVTIAVYKSNREYARELLRRAHDRPSLLEAFQRNVRLLEGVWYGTNEATDALVQTFLSRHDIILDDERTANPPAAEQRSTGQHDRIGGTE